SSNLFNEVMQMNFEITSFSSLSGTQPITWQVEYPRKGTTDIAVSEIFIIQKDLVAIVPLAMDTELLNTAILTGKTVAMPVRVVSLEENSTVRDISELVECKALDEDVIKSSRDPCDIDKPAGLKEIVGYSLEIDRCPTTVTMSLSMVKEIKGKVDSVVNFTYQHLEHTPACHRVGATASLQIEVSDTELSQEAIVSTWLQFSDGSVTSLDIYDNKDFSLSATSLDEAVVSIPQAFSPWWPTVVAEGEGQGPLLRVDMSIAEACQKSKRKSVLAVGIGHVGVKFGWEDAESSQTGDKDEEGIKNHASDRRQKIQDLERPGQDEHYHGNSPGDREEGALLSATTTAKSLLDNKVGKSGRLDGARLHSIPIDFTNFPAQVDLPKAGSTLEENGLMQTAHGLSDLEIGMYALLGVFCLAILVFLINCATFAFKYRHKQEAPEAVVCGDTTEGCD
ncbi:hypothetical protein STEG23_021243, partial [Scotinomys teguina]